MTLTLEQVKKARRFAWHLGTVFYAPGYPHRFFSVCVGETPHSFTFEGVDWFDGRTLGSMYDAGWCHLPGCDCEFCKAGTHA